MPRRGKTAMKNYLAYVSACLLLATAAAAQQSSAPVARPLAAMPYSPSLDLSSLDRSVDPCQDFYRFSCGGWMKNNPIPADQPRWDVYGKLYEDNQRFLWGILDDLSKKTTGRNPNQQKIGDFFGACMDESAIEKLGASPLKPYLAQINGMKSKKDLASVLAALHLKTQGSGFLFGFGSNQDFANSESIIAFVGAGGLSLPDRDYYTKTDEHSVEIRNKFLDHVQKMLELLGDTPGVAPRAAARIMEIASNLSIASLTRVARRAPYKLFHKV